MLRLDTQNLSLAKRARLLVKYAMYPGTNWVSREKAHVVRMFLQGTPEQPIRTLDCGCGNAYFSYQAVKRHSRCTGITIHEWEKHNCEEMRSFLGVSPSDLEFRVTNLAALADDPAERENTTRCSCSTSSSTSWTPARRCGRSTRCWRKTDWFTSPRPTATGKATRAGFASPGTKTAGMSATATRSSSSSHFSKKTASSRSTDCGSARSARRS